MVRGVCCVLRFSSVAIGVDKVKKLPKYNLSLFTSA